MIQIIVSSSEPVTLVGAGACLPSDIAMARRVAPRLVAADGGADTVLKHGHMPEAVIGDFDSLSNAVRDAVPADQMYPIAEQDSTDFEKALRRISAPLIVGAGFMGARVDHELAALHVMLRFSDRPIVLLSEYEVIFHCPPHLTLDLEKDSVVSLFPLSTVSGTSQGLFWPIDGLEMAPGRQVGTSNRAIGGRVELAMQNAGMLVLLPKANLDQVVTALMAGSEAHAQ